MKMYKIIKHQNQKRKTLTIHNSHYEKRNNSRVLEFYCLVFVGIRATTCSAQTVGRETMFTGGNNNTNEVVDSRVCL